MVPRSYVDLAMNRRASPGPTGVCRPRLDMFGTGISLAGVQLLASQAAARTTQQAFDEIWAEQMIPPGWRFSPAVGSGPYAFTDDQGRVTEEPPSGTKAMCDILARSSPDLVGPPTHFVSFPWSLPFRCGRCTSGCDRARCRRDADFYHAVLKRMIGSCGQLM